MLATEHPEYKSEQEHLERSLNAADVWAKELQDLMGSNLGADKYTSQTLRNMNASDLQMVRYIQSNPYFGRVNFCPAGSPEAESFYIGEYALHRGNMRVISWKAPIARLFYASAAARTGYRSPSGEIEGRLELKRRFVIQNRTIGQILDEVDRRGQPRERMLPSTTADSQRLPSSRPQPAIPVNQPAPSAMPIAPRAEPTDPDEFLRSLLSGASDARLHKIVTSIQTDQYALIEADAEQALVVQGAAGSGKTSIALHRLAFLLYPANGKDIRAARCIVFGPNRMFLTYVSSLLPKLGVEGITQTTLAQWALERFNSKVRDLTDVAFDTILSPDEPRARKVELYRRSQLRTSWRMATLLERYIEHRRGLISFTQAGWTVRTTGGSSPPIHVARRELIAAFRKFSSLPFGVHRKRFLQYIEHVVEQKYDAHVQGDGDMDSERRNKDVKSLHVQLARLLAVDWPPFDPFKHYQALLANEALLEELCDGLFTENERVWLTIELNNQRQHTNVLDLSDLPALHYLHLLIEPPVTPPYDHIVIDEAQDISELELFTLRRFFSRNGSFTILGDLPQSIYSHRGITSWTQVQNIFSDTGFTYRELRRSYRATFEIMRYANRVLTGIRRIRPGTPEVDPFERHGPGALGKRVNSDQMLLSGIRLALDHARRSGHKNIAIITKTTDRCTWLHQSLPRAHERMNLAVALSPDFDYQGGLVILPVFLAKGMEFDVAIIIDADNRTYSDTEFDGRLLYVAITRALHQLYVFWKGEGSSFLVPGAPSPAGEVRQELAVRS